MGNFGWVIADVYDKAYEPLIGALERHPTIRVGLHYSGPLLQWMSAERPESLERLKALGARDQVEMLGGGLYEPILVSLPERDRAGQLTRMREEVQALFGIAPRGAWLAERVWEPSVPFDLAAAGYEYTVLDDNHLRGASVAEDAMWGTYTTDDQGKLLTIFGTEQGLRYRIPWRPVDEVIDYLRSNATDAGDRVGIMGDDGEKFGAWPGTYELSWSREKWVDRFFDAIEDNAEWLSTVTPSSWMAEHQPIGRIYVPTSTYLEMTEWALPASQQPIFHDAVQRANDRHLPEARFLRGALWRNFQARYREINDLHKQMLRVSAAVEAMPAGATRDAARDHLYRGQSNDCYWHGWFGGIYIVHMRMATLAELIAAEDLALGDGVLAGVADYDLDGIDEVALGTAGQTLIVDVAEGAGIGSWDLRATRLALASVLRRRPEAYHRQIIEAAEHRKVEQLEDPASVSLTTAETARDLSKLIVYDDHERRSGLVRVRGTDGITIGDFDTAPWETVDGASDADSLLVGRSAAGITVRKSFNVSGDRGGSVLGVVIEVLSEHDFAGTVELEWNVNLLGGGSNPAAYYKSGNVEWRHDSAGAVDAGAELSFGNTYEGVDISISAQPPAPAAWFAVETVSNSESGFEGVYQGSCLIQRWPLTLRPGEPEFHTVIIVAVQERDRSAEVAERTGG